MYVINRFGKKEDLSFDQVLYRIRNLCALPDDLENLKETHPEKYEIYKQFTPLKLVDYGSIARDTVVGIFPGVKTSELDILASSIAQPKITKSPEYGILASRLIISNFEKNHICYLTNNFGISDTEIKQNLLHYTAKALYENKDINGTNSPLLDPRTYKIMIHNSKELEKLVNYNNDYNYSYSGFKLLEESYLQKCSITDYNNEIIRVPIERPQQMLLRVAIGIHCAKPYIDYNKSRQDDMAIFASGKEFLQKYLHKSTYKKIQKAAFKNKVIWREVIQIIKNKCPIDERESRKEELFKFVDIMKKNTLSWEQILERNDIVGDGTITEKQWKSIRETYIMMSELDFTQATPTLFNSGTLHPQMSSCFLVMLPYDSMDGITDYYKICSEISKWAGGIGSSVHIIRPRNSYIRGTNGTSNGLVPMLKVVNDISVYVDQGGNKRPGSHAVYIEPSHADVEEVVDMKKQRGNDAERGRALFYAMWISDEFMRTVKREAKMEKALRKKKMSETEIKEKTKLWYLMSEDVSEDLSSLYDEKLNTQWVRDEDLFDPKRETEMKLNYAFTYQYRKYIKEGKYMKNVRATDILKHIYDVIIETGVPYMLNKDACNRKSNQKNLGTIRCSNLCCEILEFTSPEEIAVCNLASLSLTKLFTKIRSMPNEYYDKFQYAMGFDVSLKKLIDDKVNSSDRMYIDWAKYDKIIRRMVRNLDRVIDVSYYPVKQAKRSNLRHRPIGIGIQDLANMFTMLRIPFDSDEANRLNFYLFEFLYYTALDESSNLAQEYRNELINELKSKSLLTDDEKTQLQKLIDDESSGSYETFKGSPASKGILQFDLWRKEQESNGRDPIRYPLSLDWDGLKTKIKRWGLRHSLMIAPMPTGSTSSIMDNSACFEAHNSLYFKKRDKTGENVKVNRYFINDMIELGYWDDELRNEILLSDKGSISHINRIPKKIRDIYKTVWDIELRDMIDMALTRAVFIDQSQSFNWFVPKPTIKILSKEHMYLWENGAKTSSYYTRRLAVADAQKTQVVDINKSSENIAINTNNEEDESELVCRMDADCKVCHS